MIYKRTKFLVEILELLVFCPCHIFHRHTVSQHNPFGHLNFLLHSPQCTHKFHLHLPKAQIKIQTTQMHPYKCYFPLSYTCVLDPKNIFFTTVIVKSETSIFFLAHLLVVIKSHSYLQSQNPSYTKKG